MKIFKFLSKIFFRDFFSKVSFSKKKLKNISEFFFLAWYDIPLAEKRIFRGYNFKGPFTLMWIKYLDFHKFSAEI